MTNEEILKRKLKQKQKKIKELFRAFCKSYNHLQDLTKAVDTALEAFDREMKKPVSHERGKRIAKICNALNLQNDLAKRFGL